jgi:hypothetical protein
MKFQHLALGAFVSAAALLATATAHAAEPFDSKLQASIFKTKLVQAVDECVGGATTIGGVDACVPTNATTDGTFFSIGSVSVKSRFSTAQVLTIIKSSGNGDVGQKSALGGKKVGTRLVVRVTKRTTAANPTDPVTWTDQVLDCVPAPPNDIINGTGNRVSKMTLAQCGLDTDLVLDHYQKEIVSASVIDVDTGEAIAVPGVRKK